MLLFYPVIGRPFQQQPRTLTDEEGETRTLSEEVLQMDIYIII